MTLEKYGGERKKAVRAGKGSEKEEIATMVNTNPRRAKPRNPQFRVSGKISVGVAKYR